MVSNDEVFASKAILILDDESDIVFVFRKSLELSGYTVFAFTDPLAAFEHLEINKDRYGLVISDVRMPKMSGIEFATKVRTFSTSVPIVLMSAYSMVELKISPDLNISQMLQKPVTPIQLKELVTKYIPITVQTSES